MLSERKRRARQREQSQGFGLSFVDLVSGGFGAAFFLFLIFASLPVDSPALSVGGGARFLEVQLHWEKGPRRIEIYLEADGTAHPIRLSSGSFEVDSETGILNWTGEGSKPFWSVGTSSGFTWFGPGAMEEAGPEGRNAIRFRLIDPCGVTLRVGGSIHSTSRGVDWLQPDSQPPITAELRVIISSGSGLREVYDAEFELTNSVAYPSEFTINGQTVAGAIEIDPPTSEVLGCQ